MAFELWPRKCWMLEPHEENALRKAISHPACATCCYWRAGPMAQAMLLSLQIKGKKTRAKKLQQQFSLNGGRFAAPLALLKDQLVEYVRDDQYQAILSIDWTGECHRYPPGGDAHRWPKMPWNEWCGEYRRSKRIDEPA